MNLHAAQVVSMERLGQDIIPLLEEGYSLKLTVTGNSMYPFLRHKVDEVELKSLAGQSVKKGDIILFVRNNEEYILHRVVKSVSNKRVFVCGDAQSFLEGPIENIQMIARVTKVYRNNRVISCGGTAWKALSYMWIILLPLRSQIIVQFRKLRGNIHEKKGK